MSATVRIENVSTKQVVHTKTRRIEMSDDDKQANQQIIKNMNRRINYLHNPRFKESKRPVMFSDINDREELMMQTNSPESSFKASPSQLIFRDYMINHVYEMEIRLTNISNVLKRVKIMPPEKPEFALGSIKYPSLEHGYVAPGMAIITKIRFFPSSFAEFDDCITLLMEENIFRVPILARKEPPNLDIPGELDCKSCWLGDQIEVKFKVTNTGGEAGYRFFNNEEVNEEYLQVGSFMLSPVEFFLQKNESQEIIVIFRPQIDGPTNVFITLGCDNQTSTQVELRGCGNTVEFAIDAIDENQVLQTFTKIFFAGIPGQVSSRRLYVRNKTSVQVNYHWTVFSDDTLYLGDEGQDLCFKVSPQQGVFKPDEVLEFLITLFSDSYYPISEFANLIIDDIPFEAIRNPPTSLQDQLALLCDSSGNRVPVFGSNSIRPSITYFEFEFLNQAELGTVSVDPPFYSFPNIVTLNDIAKHMFTLHNHSKCSMKFRVFTEMASKGVESYIPIEEGVIEPLSLCSLELGIKCFKTGSNHKITYLIDFDYGDSLSVELMAICDGARIRILEPMVNFGLIKSQGKGLTTITTENLTAVPAVCQIHSESKSLKLSIKPDKFTIPAFQKQIITIEFNATVPETFKDFLLVEVGGTTQVLEIFSEVQSPSVSLNCVIIDIDCIFSGNTYTFDERSQNQIIMQNLGNVPTPFEWNVPESPKYQVTFEPRTGTIAPKSNLVIKFAIKPRQGGVLQEIFICDLEGMEMPLGFEFRTTVKGLDVEFEVIESISTSQQSRRSPSYFRKSFTSKTLGASKLQELEASSQKLEKLQFFNCIISQPKQMKFLLKNTSGINTQFRFYFEKFEAFYPELQQTITSSKFNESQSMTQKPVRSIIKKVQPPKPSVLLTDKIEKTQTFTSAAGQTLLNKKKLENDQRHYLSNNLGVAIVCEPTKGQLPAYGSVLVTVSAFNDICGLFTDQLFAEITGLPLYTFPVTIDIRGSPIIITPHQLGISYGEPTPSFYMGMHLRNSGAVSREFRVTNTGPKDILLDWKCYNLGGEVGEQSYFDIQIVEPPLGSDKIADVLFIAREPKEVIGGPFIVHPKDARIKGRREKVFNVTFQAGELNVFNSVIVANPMLTEQSADYKLGSISLYLNAETIQPSLYLDKIQRHDSQHIIKFQHWSSGYNKHQDKQLCLTNKLMSGFVCNLEVEGPFRLLQASTNSPARYELQASNSGKQTSFSLVQGSNIEAVVRFEGPQCSNLEEWPMNYKVYKHGVLNVYFANGDQQSFKLEGVLLRPFLRLNTSGIENLEGPSVLDFGTVHINNKNTQQVFLSNLSSVPAQWKLHYVKYPVKKNLVEMTMTRLDREDETKTDDQSVFEFQISDVSNKTKQKHQINFKGYMLRPIYNALPNRMTLKEIYDLGIEPCKILINFRPKTNILYKCKYRIVVKDGPAVELVVKGCGTYDENREK